MKDLEELNKHLCQLRVSAIYQCGTPRRDGKMHPPKRTQTRCSVYRPHPAGRKTAELLYHTGSPGALIYSSHFCVNASFLWCPSFLPSLGFPIISLWGQYFVSPPPAHLRINSFLSAHYLYFALSKLLFSEWQEKGRFPGSQEAVALE